MALKTLVKVGEVNNLSDARYCAGMGVELIGFQLENDHEKFVDQNTYKAITGWLEGVKFVGEFESSSFESIQEAHKNYEFDFVQVADPSIVEEVKKLEIPVILKTNLQDWEALPKTLDADYLLVESEKEQLSDDDKVKLEEVAQSLPVILGFGLEADSVADLLDNSAIKGIALKGGEEIRPGYKDFDELADILEAIEEEY